MPQSNARGGKSSRRTSRKQREIKSTVEIDPESGNGFYGEVLKIAGGSMVDVKLDNGTRDKARIPGRFISRRCWFRSGDIIRISSDKEIISKVMPNDEDINIAKERLGKIDARENGGVMFSNEYNSDDSDDDNLNNVISSINYSKKDQHLKHRQQDKERDLQRRGDRSREVTYDAPKSAVDQSSSETSDSDITSEKQEYNKNKSKDKNNDKNNDNDDIDFDAI